MPKKIPVQPWHTCLNIFSPQNHRFTPPPPPQNHRANWPTAGGEGKERASTASNPSTHSEKPREHTDVQWINVKVRLTTNTRLEALLAIQREVLVCLSVVAASISPMNLDSQKLPLLKWNLQQDLQSDLVCMHPAQGSISQRAVVMRNLSKAAVSFLPFLVSAISICRMLQSCIDLNRWNIESLRLVFSLLTFHWQSKNPRLKEILRSQCLPQNPFKKLFT